ncbi:hypothetical protein K503DRAFT_868950 [Rhizopogon vinicolor AM-OR11-026]|uniref:MIF4G domain-containing protein n=1 Tax=Rhizopogon vinicolor AM-OR11-026 TaxID=1314800 RepID=A0A1B7MP60_9AGAM|nr:hypothetical protein K503DRAFT_868950 [Rhizopogon vinicolor AM-OR11-026]
MRPQQSECSGALNPSILAEPHLLAQLPFFPLVTTRFIQNLNDVEHPEGINSPKVELNRNLRNGRFRYDRKASTATGTTPTQFPSQSAWARGPPQRNSSTVPSPRSQSSAPPHTAVAISHSRRPSALGQGVSVKDGVTVPRNNAGSVRPASVVVFGSIDDASAPLSSSPASTPAVKTEVIKSFGTVPATSSNHVNGKTTVSASATGSSKQPARPSLSSPSNSSTTTSSAATSTASTPKPTINKADIAKLFQNPFSPSSQPSSDTSSHSTRPSNLPHHQPSSSTSQPPPQPSQLGAHSYTPFVPGMRPPQQSVGGKYPMDPYNQPQHPWYYTMPSQHMHQQPHQHVPHSAPPHQPGPPLPMSPRPAASPLPGTPTVSHAVPHSPQPPPSISSPPPTPTTASAPRLNTNASAFIPRPSRKVTIKSRDGVEVTLDALKKHSPQLSTVPIPPTSRIVTSRGTPSIRIESEETRRLREKALRKEQEKKDAEERVKKEEEEKKREEQQEAERKRMAEEERIRKDEEVDDIVETPSPVSEPQEPEDGEGGEVSDADETPEPQLNGDSGKKSKEAPRIVTSLMPPSSELPRRCPGPLDLASVKRDISVPPPSALFTACFIENLSEVEYPEGIKSPKAELNANAKDGRFRYDRDFLMQFMHICREKPPTLPPLDVLGIEPIDQSSFAMSRGSSGRHRNPSGAMPPSATRQASVGLGIGGFQKSSAPSPFQMGNFQSSGSKLTSEERFALSSNVRSAPTSSGDLPFNHSPMVPIPSEGCHGNPTGKGSKRTRSKRGQKHGDSEKAMLSQQGHSSAFGSPSVAPILSAGFEPVVPLEMSVNRWVPTSSVRKAQPDVDTPEMIDRKIKALLNKLTIERFDSISDQIIQWVNKSVGRTLVQAIRLMFEMMTEKDAWIEMYARLCRKMMEQIGTDVQDNGIKNPEGKPIAGGQLFRKYLLNRCQEDFERGWFAKDVVNQKDTEEAEVYSDEYFAAQKAKRQVLGLIKFIGELFQLQMLTERIMHEFVKKLLGNVENPKEEEIERLCQLLKTVGQLLDTPKARARMDVYFTRMKELGKSTNASSRVRFMLQDVVELRERKWVSRNAAMFEAIGKARAGAENGSCNRQASKSRGGSRRRGERNQEFGPDGWAVSGDSVSRPLPNPKAGDLSQFGKISKGAPMVMGPSSLRESPSRTSSSSNMSHMLSRNPELTPESVGFDQTGVPESNSSMRNTLDPNAEALALRKKLKLLPRFKPSAVDRVPADIKQGIDEHFGTFFTLRDHEDAGLVVYALENSEAGARRVCDFLVRAASNGQCTPHIFEEGFMPVAGRLDEVAIEFPKAYYHMAMMLKGAGFKNEPERLQRIVSKLEDSDKLISHLFLRSFQ